jgi:transposase
VHAVREILNAIFDVLRSGCAWRRLPHDLPPLTQEAIRAALAFAAEALRADFVYPLAQANS